MLRLLRGEELELVSRELGVTAATLFGWRDDFLAGGQAALKSRPADDLLSRIGPRVQSYTLIDVDKVDWRMSAWMRRCSTL